ncbi:MAG: D-alanyl-D-alanine carboxypeptidase/D-alanyl-D-alanine-endopeptidase, partial [Acidobacteriota bacterium]|nr:D-alanyl-D-alanine carboxypeptidase/D-alanyl-D-alanine-endopeptidase [Acidobacteriota bacterium]
GVRAPFRDHLSFTLRLAMSTLALLALLAAAAAPASPAPDPLPAEVRRALASSVPEGANVSLLARVRGEDEPLARLDADRTLIPASTGKLFTTACALDTLGPSHRFTTEFLADGGMTADGVLKGPLYVRGGGDPQLKGEDLWAAVRHLVSAGLTRIEGGLVGDDAALEPPGRPPSWPRSGPAGARSFHAAQGALSLAWNSLELVVRPGPAPGRPARVALFPLEAPVRVAGRVVTGPKTDVRYDLVEADGSSPATLTVSGSIRAGAGPWRRWVRLGHPTRAVLRAARELLERSGVSVKGPILVGRAPEGATLLHARESRRLADLVSDINKYSSNFGAELLLRALARASGRTGSTAEGLEELGACASRLGVSASGVRLADGSGYGRANRLSAASLVQLLAAGAASPRFGAELVASLPRAGEDGSLRRRLVDHAGRVRAKTGSLSGVAALAGYATTEGGTEITFAILVNGDGAAVGPATVDGLLRGILAAAARREREERAAAR